MIGEMIQSGKLIRHAQWLWVDSKNPHNCLYKDYGGRESRYKIANKYNQFTDPNAQDDKAGFVSVVSGRLTKDTKRWNFEYRDIFFEKGDATVRAGIQRSRERGKEREVIIAQFTYDANPSAFIRVALLRIFENIPGNNMYGFLDEFGTTCLRMDKHDFVYRLADEEWFRGCNTEQKVRDKVDEFLNNKANKGHDTREFRRKMMFLAKLRELQRTDKTCYNRRCEVLNIPNKYRWQLDDAPQEEQKSPEKPIKPYTPAFPEPNWAVDDDEDETMCPICMDQPLGNDKDTDAVACVFIQCLHVCCAGCAARCQKRGDKCCVCRQIIMETFQYHPTKRQILDQWDLDIGRYARSQNTSALLARGWRMVEVNKMWQNDITGAKTTTRPDWITEYKKAMAADPRPTRDAMLLKKSPPPEASPAMKSPTPQKPKDLQSVKGPPAQKPGGWDEYKPRRSVADLLTAEVIQVGTHVRAESKYHMFKCVRNDKEEGKVTGIDRGKEKVQVAWNDGSITWTGCELYATKPPGSRRRRMGGLHRCKLHVLHCAGTCSACTMNRLHDEASTVS